MFFKKKIIRDEKHRRFIASLPCCVTGFEGQTQCAHVRYRGNGGMGLKPSDDLCVPLCVLMHAYQHHVGELNFWKADRIEDVKKLARALYENTGDDDKCVELVEKFRLGGPFDG